MKQMIFVAFSCALVVSGVCANTLGLDYTDSLAGGLGNHGVSGVAASPVLSGKGLVRNALSKICPLDCPFGTVCSTEFGAPRCVSSSGVGLGGYLGNGLGLHNNPTGLGLGLTRGHGQFGFGRCAPLTPACIATRFDRFEQCRYTFDLRLRRCVKVYVRKICAILDGPHRNLFSSRFECERSCAGRLTY